MRISLISDIHANEVAFDSVIDDIREFGTDQIVFMGDAATLGPLPGPTLEKIQDLKCPCIMGNHDEFLLDVQLVKKYTNSPAVLDAIEWCRGQLSENHFDFVRTFDPQFEITLNPRGNLKIYHGSPRSHMEDILATTPPDDLDKMLKGQTATVLACGHTHIQMLRQHMGTLIVNPGSVGSPFLRYVGGQEPELMDHAEYATIEVDENGIHVHMRRVSLNRKKMYRTAEASDIPLRSWLMEQYA